MRTALAEFDRGSYDARRAAALSGVPLSTVYYWARHGPVTPSVSATKEKLWSYGDLIRLRTVFWLRHVKQMDGRAVARTSMGQVRRVLQEVERASGTLWSPGDEGRVRVHLLVDDQGRLYHEAEPLVEAGGQVSLLDRSQLDLLGPFVTETSNGPDLVEPRPRLRVIPGKCAGEPHLVGSRLETRTVMALAARGFSLDEIFDFYPDDDRMALDQALEFERSLVPRLYEQQAA